MAIDSISSIVAGTSSVASNEGHFSKVPNVNEVKLAIEALNRATAFDKTQLASFNKGRGRAFNGIA